MKMKKLNSFSPIKFTHYVVLHPRPVDDTKHGGSKLIFEKIFVASILNEDFWILWVQN